MSSCDTCAFSEGPRDQNKQLVGLTVGGRDYVVALAGNPNTGKSTVFNQLTGLRQHTGNWPGKTVARAEGSFVHGGSRFKLVDLPGTYSLLADSIDEQIARDYVLFERPDCTIVVCDATVLERNLNLVLQVLQITGRVVVCANLMDEARRKGLEIDTDALERELGVPVVPTAARHGEGLDRLLDRVHEVAQGKTRQRPARIEFDADVEAAIAELADQLSAAIPGLACARWVATRLLDGDQRVRAALESGELAAVSARVAANTREVAAT